MAIQTKSNRLAIVVESTEGTPVAPSGAGDFVPIQDDAEIETEFDTLDNDELTGSLGGAKPIQGLENPTASLSLYLKGSGTAGDAPGYGELLKTAFGSEDDAGVEHNTVSGSTTTVINVDTGEGATYVKAQLLLIKDPVNGTSVRPIESISSDALTLGFALDNAPGTGVDLGEAITYLPTDSGHQTLSVWGYMGNGGLVKMMSGARVVNLAIEMAAAELINASYSLEGLEGFQNPLEVTSSDIFLDFTDDGGTFAAQITAQFYKDPHELATALTTAMNTIQTDEVHLVAYSNSTGKYTISTSTSAVLTLLWNTGGNTANTVGDVLAFTIASDDSGSTSYEGDNALTLSSPFTPSFDSVNPIVAKNMTVFIGSQTDNICVDANTISFTLDTPKTDILSSCAASGKSSSLINERVATMEIAGSLNQYDVEFFRRLRTNAETRIFVSGGPKSGGNLVEGEVFGLYLPTAVITALTTPGNDGILDFNITVQAYVGTVGEVEVALGFI